MFEIIIIVIIVLIVLTGVMFIFLKKIVKDINSQSKEYFALKLQDYDELVEERKQKLIELEEEKGKELEKTKELNKQEVVVRVDDKVLEYQVDDILQKVKNIDNQFDIDKENTIREFLNKKMNLNTIQLYRELITIKQRIENFGIYNLLIQNESITDQFFENISDDTKKLLMKNFVYQKNRNILAFLENLNIEIEKHSPLILIEVGEKSENYNYLSPYIETVYNQKIYRGIKIYYQNQLYDYSIE